MLTCMFFLSTQNGSIDKTYRAEFRQLIVRGGSRIDSFSFLFFSQTEGLDYFGPLTVKLPSGL